MQVTFVGTAVGTQFKRNVTSIAIEVDDSKIILVDCEATLHQFMRSKLKITNIHTILITHLHGDHIFGILGLCCTLNEARTQPLHIYGPIGVKKYCDIFKKSIYNYELIIHEIIGTHINVGTIRSNTFIYNIEACFIKHSAECFAYFIKKIKVIPKINMEKLQPVLSKYNNEIVARDLNHTQNN